MYSVFFVLQFGKLKLARINLPLLDICGKVGLSIHIEQTFVQYSESEFQMHMYVNFGSPLYLMLSSRHFTCPMIIFGSQLHLNQLH